MRKKILMLMICVDVMAGALHISPKLYAKEEDRGIRARLESAQKSFSKFKKRLIKNYKKRSRRQKVVIGAAAVVGGASMIYLGSIAARVALALYRGDQKGAFQLAKDIPARDMQKMLQLVGGHLKKLTTGVTALMPSWIKKSESEFPAVDDAEQMRRFMEFVPEGQEREQLSNLIRWLPRDEKLEGRRDEIQKLRSFYPVGSKITMEPRKKFGLAYWRKKLRGRRLISQGEKNKRSPLLDAISFGQNIEDVKALIAAGVDVNEKFERDLPLIHAAKSGNLEIVRALIAAGADVNAQARNTTALKTVASTNINMMDATSRGYYLDIAKALIAAGSDIDSQDKYGMTAIMWAARAGRFKIVKALIAAGADVNAKSKIGETAPAAIVWAVRAGRFKIVKALIAAGADVNAKNTIGKTALNLAIVYGDVAMTDLLRAAGAK